ncbi:MAG: hypothetical protein R3B90_11950 [Planctomycetaceae bacterium]
MRLLLIGEPAGWRAVPSNPADEWVVSFATLTGSLRAAARHPADPRLLDARMD